MFPDPGLLGPRLVFLALGLLLTSGGLYSFTSGRPGIFGWQFFAEDRQTIRQTPVRLLRQAGVGMTLFGAGAVIWSASGFPSPGAPIALAMMALGTVLLIVVGISIPFTRKTRVLSGLLGFIGALVGMSVLRLAFGAS
jgi:hypothetical protein